MHYERKPVTHLAYVRLVFRMRGQMLTQVCSRFECLLAVWTHEGEEVSVCLDMFTQFVRVFDALIAVVTDSFLELVVHDMFRQRPCAVGRVAALRT